MAAKWVRDFEHRRGLLEAILVEATTKKEYMFPTIERYIYVEVIQGTLDYTTGCEHSLDSVKEFGRYVAGKELLVYNYFKKNLPKKALDLKIKKHLMKLLEPNYSHDEWGDASCHAEFFIHFTGYFGGGICQAAYRSTFALSPETVIKVEKKVMPKLTKAEKKAVKGIGEHMRKYVQRDLDFIKAHYYW